MDELTYKRMKLIKDIVRNPLFDDAVKAVRADVLSALADTGLEAAEEREYYYLEILALSRIVGKLRTIANDVVHAEDQAQRGAA